MGRPHSILRRSVCGGAQGRKVLRLAPDGGAVSLLALQRRMAAALMLPLAAGDHIDPEASADYIKPNDRLTSLERPEIYSRSYWYRLLDSLYEDFPGLRAVLGQRA